MENNLSSKEIDTLVEALEAWETKDNTGRLLGGLMSAMLSDKMGDEAKAKMEAAEKEREEKAEREQKQRKETSLLLKAKLVMMKHGKAMEELVK